MSEPALTLIDLVAVDVDATVAFYRALGLTIPEEAVWRTASGAHHVDIDFPGGFGLHFDSHALAKAYNAGWTEPAGRSGRVVLGFKLPDSESVDRLYAELTALGYRGAQPPYVTFWGARYAAGGPDGNPVGLTGPTDPTKRGRPPEL